MRSRPAIRTYTGVAELAWLQQILAFGWDCRPLGPPARLECGTDRRARDRDRRPDTPALLAANDIWDLAGGAAGPHCRKPHDEERQMSDLKPGLAPQVERWTQAAARAGLVRDPIARPAETIEALDADLAGDFDADALLQRRLLRSAHQEVRPAARALAAAPEARPAPA